MINAIVWAVVGVLLFLLGIQIGHRMAPTRIVYVEYECPTVAVPRNPLEKCVNPYDVDIVPHGTSKEIIRRVRTTDR